MGGEHQRFNLKISEGFKSTAAPRAKLHSGFMWCPRPLGASFVNLFTLACDGYYLIDHLLYIGSG
jgi:hypothetical protein